jgi:hypothetical protein
MNLFNIINRLFGNEVLEGEVLDPISNKNIVVTEYEVEIIECIVIEVEPIEVYDTYVIYALPNK